MTDDTRQPRCASCLSTAPLHSDWILVTENTDDEGTASKRPSYYCSLRCAGTRATVDAVHESAQARRAGRDGGDALGLLLVGGLLTFAGEFKGEPMPRGIAQNLDRRPTRRKRRKKRRKRS